MSKANDQLANYIAQYPNRFVAFSFTSMSLKPQREFERCINDLGFKGALIMGRAQDGLIKTNMTLFSKAENLDVPIYLHPAQLTVTLGFATLPINEPEAAAREFERCINDLGFKGALIMGRAQDGFLDQDKYDIIFKKLKI